MKKTATAGIVLLLLLFSLRSVSASDMGKHGNITVACSQIKLVGTWDEFTGFYTKIGGNCSAFLVNPFNVSVRYNHTE